MFYTIHRAIKALLYCVVAFVGWKIYEHRQIFEPAIVWAQVWDNGGFRVEQPENIGGNVVSIVNSQTFTMTSKSGVSCNVRLLGLHDPPRDQRELERKKALENMIKGRWVHVEKFYENANNLGGVVYCQGTNVNANLVLLGLATTSKELIKSFPKEDQFSLLWAERRHLNP